jgi:uncharacterized glyoxalase superfamily protein PhnB
VSTTTSKWRVAPAGYTSVTPWIPSPDTVKLLDFAKRAFGAEELACLPGTDGSIDHAEFRVGDAVIMAFDTRPSWGPTRAFLRLYVEDCEAVYRRALDAGASSVTRPTDLFFGERVARVRDPHGNIWWIHSRVEDVPPEEMQRRARDKKYVEAMTYLQSSLEKAMSAA